ncbi:hypothetical protein ABZY31_26180 [Streptomyces sp. NPDC006529]|uniref:hypothetical protein n=1 Tax=Streptomyces sp. NPDC006529 TaxID=3157177 RepID=UPI0033A8951A
MTPQVVDQKAPPARQRPDPGAESTRPAPSTLPAPERTDAELLIAASVLLADAALTAKQVGAELTGALSSWRFGLEALQRPAWALGAAPSRPYASAP